MKYKNIFCILIFVLILVSACVQQSRNSSTGLITVPVSNPIKSSDNSNAKHFVELVVSQDFGKTIILSQKIEINDKTSVIDALKKVAVVETKYGEGFIDSIDGLKSEFGSGKKLDWFYYVNGFSPNFAANQYFLQEGDKVQFDFHDWSYQLHIPAYLGEFPEPLKNGFNGKTFPTTIVFSPEFEAKAKQLQQFLQEKYQINSEIIPFSQLSEQQKKSNNLLLLAPLNNALIVEINSNHRRNGLFLYFENNELIELNSLGERNNSFDSAGAIFAVANFWNDKGILAQENIVFVFTGTNNESIEKAIDIVLNSPQELNNSFGLIISNNSISKVAQ